uniref:Odorant-binding protein 4 n=1 Tax=Yemma signatus TaxID=300820 RepID=A0A3G2GRR5_9HEMI|nr:odorant-binding protein 4 [Yemma signatus]
MGFKLVLLAVVCVAAAALTQDEWDNVWDKAEKKCEHLMKFARTSPNSLPSIDDIPRRAKCFVSCFFDEVGLTNGTEINHELYTSWLEEELKFTKNKEAIIATVKKCIDGIERTEKCRTAYELYECFGKKFFS